MRYPYLRLESCGLDLLKFTNLHFLSGRTASRQSISRQLFILTELKGSSLLLDFTLSSTLLIDLLLKFALRITARPSGPPLTIPFAVRVTELLHLLSAKLSKQYGCLNVTQHIKNSSKGTLATIRKCSIRRSCLRLQSFGSCSRQMSCYLICCE